MKVFRAIEWKGGWFAGDFEPAAYRTKDFEAYLKRQPKGEKWPAHYHKVATEINYLILWHDDIGGEKLTAGDVFVLEPGEIADPEFLEDCEMIVIKAPSAKNDKYVTEK